MPFLPIVFRCCCCCCPIDNNKIGDREQCYVNQERKSFNEFIRWFSEFSWSTPWGIHSCPMYFLYMYISNNIRMTKNIQKYVYSDMIIHTSAPDALYAPFDDRLDNWLPVLNIFGFVFLSFAFRIFPLPHTWHPNTHTHHAIKQNSGNTETFSFSPFAHQIDDIIWSVFVVVVVVVFGFFLLSFFPCFSSQAPQAPLMYIANTNSYSFRFCCVIKWLNLSNMWVSLWWFILYYLVFNFRSFLLIPQFQNSDRFRIAWNMQDITNGKMNMFRMLVLCK